MSAASLLSAMGISPEDTDSEMRGKVARVLLAGGIHSSRLPSLIAAKRSQHYVDLRNAYRSEARKARQFNPFGRSNDDDDGEKAA